MYGGCLLCPIYPLLPITKARKQVIKTLEETNLTALKVSIVWVLNSVKRPQGKSRPYHHTHKQHKTTTTTTITTSLHHLLVGPPARTMIRSKYVPPGGIPMQDPFGRVSSVKSGRSSHVSFELKTYTKNCKGMLLKASVSVGLAKSSIMAATP